MEDSRGTRVGETLQRRALSRASHVNLKVSDFLVVKL